MDADPGAPVITKHILKLARQLDSTSSPVLVPVTPGAECLVNQCFENVPRIVKSQGGSTQHGWIMREQPQVFAEGAFHAVWRTPEGDLIDVTPRTDGKTQIVFLPDSKLVWEGDTIEPRRLMLHEKPCYCGSGMPFRICHGLAED